jgi:hypothetical protein
VTLTDGSVLMPLAWFRDVKLVRRGPRTIITYRQDMVDRMGARDALRDARIQVATRYEFAPGRITRSDSLFAPRPLSIKSIDMEFAGFSSGAEMGSPGRVRFARGEVTRFDASGFDTCAVAAVDANPYRAPSGPLTSKVACSSAAFTLTHPKILGWTLTYR